MRRTILRYRNIELSFIYLIRTYELVKNNMYKSAAYFTRNLYVVTCNKPTFGKTAYKFRIHFLVIHRLNILTFENNTLGTRKK